jgi:histidinol-phosphate phosphatase family protein
LPSVQQTHRMADPRGISLVPDGSWTAFVDRDGVVNRRIPGDYVRAPGQFEVLPGAVEALARLSDTFGRVVVVTNQAGVGKGLIDPRDLEEIHRELIAAVERAGGRLDAVLVCPHLVEDHCPCRKPGTDLARQAVERFADIDLERSVMVGDSRSDMEFAARLGVPAVLVTGTGGEHADLPPSAEPVARSQDLSGAVEVLVGGVSGGRER